MRAQLYDLAADPLEQVNVASREPQVYKELLGLLTRHVRQVEAANPAVVRAVRTKGRDFGFGCD